MAKGQKAVGVCRVAAYAAVFVACAFLFYQQATGAYVSDLPAHMKPPEDDTYSAIRFVFQFLIGFSGAYGVAVFLAAVEVATIGVTEYLIRKMAPHIRPGVALGLALACNFLIAIYLRFVYHNFTVGSPSANRWHNSTYTAMRLFAMGAIVFYLKFDGQIRTRSRALSWVLLTAMLALATSMKPNFVVAFGPAMFVFCLIDLVRNGTKTVPKSLLVGLSLLVALGVVVYQLLILFPSDGSASGQGSIAFGLAEVWRYRNPHIGINCVQIATFPVLAAVATRPLWRRDRAFLLSWLVFAVAFAENFFLYETGHRMYHGNFGWGLCFALFFLFVMAAVAFVNARGEAWRLVGAPSGNASPESASPESAPSASAPPAAPARTPLDVATVVAFALHTASGLLYFALMLLGRPYF